MPVFTDPSLQLGRPVVAVTGASAGVGRATAVAFALRGWAVALLARSEPGLDGARQDVETAGGEALVMTVDVADAAAVALAADQIVERWGRIDVWVNNAMATVFGPADEIPPEEFLRVTQVTYLGAVHGSLAALKHMRSADRGVIVQVGSALSYRAIPLQAPYCGAKFAVRGFTDSLRCELRRQGSRVSLTMVQLPAVNTPQFDWSRTHMPHRHRPIGQVYQPEAVAEKIVRAATSRTREVWLGWTTIQAILGGMIAPGWLDRYLARTAFDPQIAKETGPTGPDILFGPIPEDRGPRGRFGKAAKSRVAGFDPRVVRITFATVLLLAAFLVGWLAGNGM